MQIYKWVPARVEEAHEKQTLDPKQAPPQNGSESIDQNGIQISSESQENGLNNLNGTANGSSERLVPEANSNNNGNDRTTDMDTTTRKDETDVAQLSSLDWKTSEITNSSADARQNGERDKEAVPVVDMQVGVDAVKPADGGDNVADESGATSVKLESMEVDEPKKDESSLSKSVEASKTACGGSEKQDESAAKRSDTATTDTDADKGKE